MRSLAVGVLLAAGTTGHAATFSFTAYSISDGAGTVIDNTVTVSAAGGVLSLTLSNDSSDGRMTAFYLELGPALAGVTGFTGSTDLVGSTNFSTSSIDPPAPSTISPSWGGNFFAMDVVSPGQVANSLGAGESMRLDFSYDGSFVLGTLIDAIAAGEIRMVQRFQSIGPTGDGSAWLVTTAVVPLPPAAWAAVGTLALIGGIRAARRRRR